MLSPHFCTIFCGRNLHFGRQCCCTMMSTCPSVMCKRRAMGLRMGNAEACVTDCKAQLKLPLLLQKVEPDSTYRNCCNILTIAQNATLSNNYNATARQVAFQYVLYKTYLNNYCNSCCTEISQFTV